MAVFNFDHDYILENERVLLRPLIKSDLENLSAFSLEEPELWNYSLTPADGLKNLKSYMEMAIAGRANKTAYPFIVFDKFRQKYAGSTRFYDFQAGHLSTQLGYTWYGKAFQGTGLNKQCKYLLLEFAFEKLDLERVEFRADALNARSIAAMKSIGCVEEGILRSNCKSVNGRRDSIILSILKNEWFASVKRKLYDKME
jgi:RimJ/RimL family protein N-acetyltransferase